MTQTQFYEPIARIDRVQVEMKSKGDTVLTLKTPIILSSTNSGNVEGTAPTSKDGPKLTPIRTKVPPFRLPQYTYQSQSKPTSGFRPNHNEKVDLHLSSKSHSTKFKTNQREKDYASEPANKLLSSIATCV